MKNVTMAALLLLLPHTVLASGYAMTTPWSIDPYGGSPVEQDAFYQGNTGILLGRAPWARLFAAWRMLHGLPVGTTAGKTLAAPCCGGNWDQASAATKAWIAARSAVPGIQPMKEFDIDVFRSVGDFYAVQTCFPDAFVTAANTLKDHVAAHGTSDPWVHVWLTTQDAVFAGCSGNTDLAPLAPDAPAWLKADHAYQQAALALYRRHFADAEVMFAAIADDPGSSWQRSARYLAARAAVTAALPGTDHQAFARARERLAALAPPDSYGHADLPLLSGALDFRDRPDARRDELARILTAPALSLNVAAEFKDSRRLGQSKVNLPAYLDWIAVFGRIPDKPEAAWFDHYNADQIWQSDADTLAHARAQWKATGDPAWLIAAMQWSNPGQGAEDLVAAAGSVPAAHPAYLTALYHRVRLASGADPDATRTALDTALARPDLSLTTRNLLLAERAMTARDLTDFARLAPRDSPCLTENDDEKGCLDGDYRMEGLSQTSNRPDIRFGEEAAALIDQLPTADRASLAETTSLPAPLRLDVALTTWVRAALQQDLAIADHLAKALVELLPQMEPEWTAYLSAQSGEEKRFAAWFILAKLPGADVSLRNTYTRPQGAVTAFDGHWHDWLYAAGNAAPPPPAPLTGDLVCFGMCGPGTFPLQVPAFIAAGAGRAAHDRGRFQPADPKAAGSVWEDVLSYAKAHPADPRSPEALYWLVRISHYGIGHNRSSFRAWVLLHNRYPKTEWAATTKYFYD